MAQIPATFFYMTGSGWSDMLHLHGNAKPIIKNPYYAYLHLNNYFNQDINLIEV